MADNDKHGKMLKWAFLRENVYGIAINGKGWIRKAIWRNLEAESQKISKQRTSLTRRRENSRRSVYMLE